MEKGLTQKLQWIQQSLSFVLPELLLGVGLFFILLLGIFFSAKARAKKEDSAKEIYESGFSKSIHSFFSLLILILVLWIDSNEFLTITPISLFGGMIKHDTLSGSLKIVFDIAAILTAVMTWRNQKNQNHISEYYALVMTVVLGSHLLVMSQNFVMIFLSLETISIASYILTGFSFTKKSAEASLKYFLFGSVASAIMLYGLSILYGLTGTLNFSSSEFVNYVSGNTTLLFVTASIMITAGFLYKIAAAPMHPWSPDVYEASPMPVVALFSVVPKLAGIGVLVKFLLAINASAQLHVDWQLIVSIVAIASLTIGNFSALLQTNPKRMMAYSSIAQAGFLLVGVVALSLQGLHFMMFYAFVYMLANFLIFQLLQYFESKGVHTFAEFSGVGKSFVWPSIFILVGLISLTGLPPTSGFTAKLLIFTSLWEAYAASGKPILLWLLVFGLLNTVVSLFYYLKIPYYAFLKTGGGLLPKQNNFTVENLLAFFLVILLLILFFLPGLLMGWINKIIFVL